MSEAKNGSPSSLEGVRVIEMGSLLAGPFCGQLLADFGAEVVKIEPPGKGDPMRVWGRHQKEGRTLWWPIIARNKKSVTLNLREAEGQELARRFIAEADVLIENFRPGTMEKWGLGYEDLREINPGLVMVRVSGYGQTGPYRERAGFGSIGEAMGGIRHVTGFPDLPPPRTGITVGCHFHDTRNTSIANAVAAVESGATVLDASVGGTGGCPFAPKATGNIATEDLVYLLHGMGFETGVDLSVLVEVARWLSEKLGKELPGQVHKAGVFEPVAG